MQLTGFTYFSHLLRGTRKLIILPQNWILHLVWKEPNNAQLRCLFHVCAEIGAKPTHLGYHRVYIYTF